LKRAHELRKLLALNTTGLKRLIRQPSSAGQTNSLPLKQYVTSQQNLVYHCRAIHEAVMNN
jgi:hypothetical protein